MDGVSVLIVAVALAAIGALAGLWRRAEARAEALGAERDAVAAERDSIAERLAREEGARRRQAEELAGLRKKEDKARRRASKAPRAPLGTATRIQDLETALARAERERDAARAEAAAADGELGRLRARLAAEASARASRAAESPEAAQPPGGETSPDATEVARERDTLEAELRDSREARARLEQEIARAKANEARLRKRILNQEHLYAALRGELEAKKDRLRTQTETLERLQALKVAVLD